VQIAEQMALDPDNFLPDKMPFSKMEQALNYHKLLLHILAQAESLGFQVGVLVAGHYPLIDHARAAVLQYNQRGSSRQPSGMLAWAFVDFLLVDQLYEHPGDHGGGWETSHMMALHPQTVDLSLLPPAGEKVVGVGGRRDPRESTAEFGRETIEQAVEIAVREVQDRLVNKQRYMRHGTSLREGLWRNANPQ
jgi:creatinine amidohydrolase